MHTHLSHYLHTKYPELLGKVPFEMRDGWFHIIDTLSSSIESFCCFQKTKLPKVVQVKEKFGTLRFYIQLEDKTYDNTFHALISMAEKLTASTCEICGDQGTIINDAFVHCSCEKCKDIVSLIDISNMYESYKQVVFKQDNVFVHVLRKNGETENLLYKDGEIRTFDKEPINCKYCYTPIFQYFKEL